MVWQDFPLACNDYRGTPHYLKILEQEAIAIINKLKRYACLVLWCGGNELFNNWSKMTDQSPALRLLNKLCYDLDPMRPFIMTSPIDGMAHGNYVFRYRDGREVYQVMPAAHNTAYTEFGVPSISNQACIKMAAEEADVFPMQRNDITIAHHAFDTFDGDKSCWACLDIIESYFGEALSLDELIEQSQWLQGEGYKCIFEEARRQKPYSSMALNWCYNEPWPTLANNSIINYPAEPKSSFKDVSDACRSTLISARIPKFTWHAGEEFTVELWLLNDSRSPVASGTTEVSIEIGSRVYPVGSWVYESAPANVNKQGPVVKIKLPDLDVTTTEDIDVDSLITRGFIEMKLKIKAGTMSSQYRLLYLKN
jgi:beta-mannosidase